MIEGEDAQTFLQDYALCPPSQRINTTSISAPFGNTVKQLVEHQGYPQLTVPSDRVGRAVLFWVDGYSSATRVIRSLINQDGRDRGLPWATEGGSRSVTKLDSPHISPEAPDALEQADSEVNRRSSARWIISFIDENEARRFVRAWHRRPWPLSGEWVRSEDAPLINAEFLW